MHGQCSVWYFGSCLLCLQFFMNNIFCFILRCDIQYRILKSNNYIRLFTSEKQKLNFSRATMMFLVLTFWNWAPFAPFVAVSLPDWLLIIKFVVSWKLGPDDILELFQRFPGANLVFGTFVVYEDLIIREIPSLWIFASETFW